MEMELGIGTNDVDASHIAKGKRTKRLRHLSPCAVTAAISSSSSASEEEHGISGGDCGSFSSTTTTATTLEGTDQEEEDMANCLILLAQGKRGGEEKNHNNKIREKSMSSRRFSEVTTTTSSGATAATKIGFFVYECKTCNRTFPSFQALGGHRASHKKPKLTPPEEKKPQLESSVPVIANCEFEETKQGLVMSTLLPPISLELGGCGANNNNNNNNRGILFHGGNGNSNSNSNKGKVHECSICGSEFTSGQALGGHMRRHRASTNNTTSAPHQDIETASSTWDNKRPRNNNVLELDLNLPAPPEDDHRDSTFHFTATQNKSIVLSASPALVGCHY